MDAAQEEQRAKATRPAKGQERHVNAIGHDCDGLLKAESANVFILGIGGRMKTGGSRQRWPLQ